MAPSHSLPRLLVLAFCVALGSLARADLAPSPEAVVPIAVGEKAPTCALPDIEGKSVDLTSVFAAHPTVLIFYRGGWCPFCNRHLAALAELEPQLRKLGFQILGISPDLPAGLGETREKHNLRYTLLSDAGMTASTAYRLAYRVSPELEEKYRGYGIALPRTPDGSSAWLPVPAAVLVGRDGRVKFVYSNADPSIRVSDEDLLAAAKAAAAP